MPYKTEWVEPEVFMTEAETGREGVIVYHLYKNDEMDNGPLTCWFTFNALASAEDGSETNFNYRELPNPAGLAKTDANRKAIIRNAIDVGVCDKMIEDGKTTRED